MHIDIFFTAGADYTSVSRDLVFAAGDTEECVLITLVDDNVQENDETFRVNITAVDPALQIFQSSAVVTIQNVMGRYQLNNDIIYTREHHDLYAVISLVSPSFYCQAS